MAQFYSPMSPGAGMGYQSPGPVGALHHVGALGGGAAAGGWPGAGAGAGAMVPGGMQPQGAQETTKLSEHVNQWVMGEVNRAWDEQLLKTRADRLQEQEPEMDTDSGGRSRKGPFHAPVFLTHRTLRAPDMLHELRQQVRTNFHLKVLPELRRMVAFVDDRLFLWNYHTGRNPAFYDASAVVTEVGVVPARRDVFAPHVTHVLVVTTMSTVELVAVAASDADCAQIRIIPLADWRLGHSNALMLKIATHRASSRIFLGGNDGCIYELCIAPRDGWTRPKMYLYNLSLPFGDLPAIGRMQYYVCERMAVWRGYAGIVDLQVDEERCLLHALDSRGLIHAWYLSPHEEGKPAPRPERVGQHAVTDAAALYVTPRQGKTRRRTDDVLVVLKQDGQRVLFRGQFNTSGPQDKLEGFTLGSVAGGGGVGSQPLARAWATVQQEGNGSVGIGELRPTELSGQPDGVDTQPGARSFVSAHCSLLLPRYPAPGGPDAPQLFGLAPLGVDGVTNAVGIVDLDHVLRAERRHPADAARLAAGGGAPPAVTSLQVSCVTEEAWGGDACGLGVPAHDLLSQLLRPPPRYLVVHTCGVTSVVRLRPVDVLHAALQGSPVRAPDAAREALTAEWVRRVFGAPETGVMLLALIAAGRAHASEERLAAALLAPPSRPVVERAKEELHRLLCDRGGSGYASLFLFFARVVKPVWNLSPADDVFRELWARRLLRVFIAPLEGLREVLDIITKQGAQGERRLGMYWYKETDELLPPLYPVQHAYPGAGPAEPGLMQARDQLKRHLMDRDCYFEVYAEFTQQHDAAAAAGAAAQAQSAASAEVLRALQHLTVIKLKEIADCTVEALRVLAAVELLPAPRRQHIAEQLRPVKLCEAVLQPAKRAGFATALMGELLRDAAEGEPVWREWQQCPRIFDPAARAFYDARKQVVTQQHAGYAGGQPHAAAALQQLQHPDVARRMLGVLPTAEIVPGAAGDDGPVRLKLICDDLRAARRWRDAAELAVTAARHCDQQRVAEKWHAYHLFGDARFAATFGVGAPPGGADAGPLHYNARARAYVEVVLTLDALLPPGGCAGMDVDGGAGFGPRGDLAHREKAAAVAWALGAEAGAYYEQRAAQRVRRPALSGVLLGGDDVLLHFYVYSWLAGRPDGDAAWPSRRDIAHVRPPAPPPGAQQPGAPPHAAAAVESVKLWVTGGRWAQVLHSPLSLGEEPWPQREMWQQAWPKWHVGLLQDLAQYCEQRGEAAHGACVLLSAAAAPVELLSCSEDLRHAGLGGGAGGAGGGGAADGAKSQGPGLLHWRRDQLKAAEEFALRDLTDQGRKLHTFLQDQRFADVAGVQLDVLGELPEILKAVGPEFAAHDTQWIEQDRRLLESRLLPFSDLYVMLHDSYDTFLPELALRLLRLKGVDRPHQQQHRRQLSQGPYKVSDFVQRSMKNHHQRALDAPHTAMDVMKECFAKLHAAAGIRAGDRAESAFLPLQILLSGLEEMAMAGGMDPPVGAPLHGFGAQMMSPVPGIVRDALGWPESIQLYEGYRQLWRSTYNMQGRDEVFSEYRGMKAEEHESRHVYLRLTAVLGQLMLEWLWQHAQEFQRLHLDASSVQRLRTELPIFLTDLQELEVRMREYERLHPPGWPPPLAQLLNECGRQVLMVKDRMAAPAAPQRVW